MQDQAFHEDFSRQEKVKGSSDRTFGLTFAVFFAILAASRFGNITRIGFGGRSSCFTLIIALVRPRSV